MGALQLAFKQVKARLAAEGLFDPARKKPIPPFPERVGIVTSLQGAAVRDMLSLLRRGSPLHIRILPVPVQGEGAAQAIAQAVADFNNHFPDTDVLLVGRGGGSLEDLWAFNEEPVARALAASRIPVISCVGHETDFTIADFAADLRAPTPSAAAEIVVQGREALIERLKRAREGLPTGLRHLVRRLAERLRYVSESPRLQDPRRLAEEPARRLDELAERLRLALASAVERSAAALRLSAEKLEALSPLAILSRGYAIATGPGGRVLRSTKGLEPGDAVGVRLHEGSFSSEVRRIEPEKTEPAP
jgi:exodeoxyribonuclease VII large subunit